MILGKGFPLRSVIQIINKIFEGTIVTRVSTQMSLHPVRGRSSMSRKLDCFVFPREEGLLTVHLRTYILSKVGVPSEVGQGEYVSCWIC